MAHFAKISEANEVLDVLHVDDVNAPNEAAGQSYLQTHNNWTASLWIQTSYNTEANQHKLGGTPFRGNYAAIGGTWDAGNNIFWDPKPYASWTKDVSTASWVPPVAEPSLTSEQQSQNDNLTHGWRYEWNESTQQWDLNNAIDV